MGEGGWGGGVAQRTKYYFYKWLWSMPEHKCEKLCVSAGFLFIFIFFIMIPSGLNKSEVLLRIPVKSASGAQLKALFGAGSVCL